MKNIATTSQCPLCDSEHVEIRHDITEHYKYLKNNHALDGQEHTVCLDCGLDYFAAGQTERNNERFMAFAKTIVKDIAPWEIHEIREKYLITQDEANRIFHCGSPTQFSKWERGECAPTGTAALMLRVALEEPATMRKLAAKAGVMLRADDADAAPVSPYRMDRITPNDHRHMADTQVDIETYQEILERISGKGFAAQVQIKNTRALKGVTSYPPNGSLIYLQGDNSINKYIGDQFTDSEEPEIKPRIPKPWMISAMSRSRP